MKSFKHAYDGIRYAYKSEKNFKIMVYIGLFVIVMNILLGVKQVDWMITLLCSGLVLGLELVNTSIERTLDMYSLKYKLQIKHIKDMLAGGVFIVAMISFIIGVLVYWPYIF